MMKHKLSKRLDTLMIAFILNVREVENRRERSLVDFRARVSNVRETFCEAKFGLVQFRER